MGGPSSNRNTQRHLSAFTQTRTGPATRHGVRQIAALELDRATTKSPHRELHASPRAVGPFVLDGEIAVSDERGVTHIVHPRPIGSLPASSDPRTTSSTTAAMPG